MKLRAVEIARLNRLLRLKRKELRLERAKWDERCPKGHLVRHDVCDLVDCYITMIKPIDTPILNMLPKPMSTAVTDIWYNDMPPVVSHSEPFKLTPSSETLHTWTTNVKSLDEMYHKLDAQFPVPRLGWFKRLVRIITRRGPNV